MEVGTGFRGVEGTFVEESNLVLAMRGRIELKWGLTGL
jgi:hypothetical protein